MSTIVREVRMIMANSENNNNKFWHGFLYDNGDLKVEFGRVGKTCQSKTHNGAGGGKLDTLERQKLKKGYVPQRTVSGTATGATSKVQTGDLETQALKDIGGSAHIQKLVSFLVKSNIHQIVSHTSIKYNKVSGQFETPLGLVTASGISEARTLLSDMAQWVVKKDYSNHQFRGLLEEYMQIIPTDVGMKRGWHETFLPDKSALQKQNDILDSLDASMLTAQTVTPTKKTTKKTAKKVFDVELDLIDSKKIFDQVDNYFRKTKGNHGDVRTLAIKRIFAVHMPAQRTAYDKESKKVKGIQELWHGTKASNLLSILKGGLIIPASSSGHCTGRMFGDGVYFSDQSTKALRYATNAWGGGGNTQRTFMFLANVAMGKPHTPKTWGCKGPPRGFDSVFAKGGVSGVSNNEMIVYRLNQIDLAHLIEFTPYGK